MKVVTWNVNSIAARKERLFALLERHAPDVICLQELKAVDEAFPMEEVTARGYTAAVFGQRTYNGVAILAKTPLTEVERGFDDGEDEADARLLHARVGDTSVVSCYVPNGQTLDSPKYVYKQRWLDRLLAYLRRRHDPKSALLVCGDFNIAPEDRDVHDPEGLRDDVLFHEVVRAKWQTLLEFGLVDTYRLHVSDAGKYSWWDYRMLSFPKAKGLRIDHILATAPLAARCVSAAIDRDERKGKQPSDHAPVMAEFT